MAARLIQSRDVKCYLCGAVTGRLVRALAAPPDARPTFLLSAHLPDGPRYKNRRLVCGWCGGPLFLDTSDDELVETQRVYPRERRGRPPGSGKKRAAGLGA
jgi:hypothetical protein